ncbi:MAG: prepilin-type N-terminal cleavage/methylation domain-containing protein, partial [Acidovorax sp.]|nr:prepilin-type N-terminal cleavage/methylation domain-containing protein [Acidovorax sp.]
MSSAAIHHRQRGLTLLEMLVAMTIMALSITVIYR